MATVGTAHAAGTRHHPIEHFARVHHATAERWLRRKFAGTLTDEDISDALAETYRQALEDGRTASFDHGRMRGWTYTALYRRAIEIIRRREGRDRTRLRDLSYDDLVATVDFEIVDDGASDFDADDHTLLAEQTALVGDALGKLPLEERTVVQHLVFDQLSLRAVAQLLGTSKSSVDRPHQRAMKRLTAVCSLVEGPDCVRARGLLDPPVTLASHQLRWRDAHLAGCFPCQVAAGRRIAVLVPLLPAVPSVAPGRASELMTRAAGVLARGGQLPPEATAAGLGGATAMGGGASLLGGGLTMKLAVCATAGAAAVACAGLTPAPSKREEPRRPPASPSVTRIVTAAADAEVAERRAKAAALAGVARVRDARSSSRRRRLSSQPPGEFAPESFSRAVPVKRAAPTRPATAATAASASGGPAAAPARSSSGAPAAATAPFSQEFAP